MKLSTYYVPESTFGSRQTKSPRELGGVSKIGRAYQMTRSILGTQKAGRGRSRGPGQGGTGGGGSQGCDGNAGALGKAEAGRRKPVWVQRAGLWELRTTPWYLGTRS